MRIPALIAGLLGLGGLAGCTNDYDSFVFEEDRNRPINLGGAGNVGGAGNAGGAGNTAGNASGGGSNACGDRTTPNTPGSCPSECASCDQGICVIECRGDGACEGREIQCPPGLACALACQGRDACRNARLRCSDDYLCRAYCDDRTACEDLRMTCGTGTCEIECTRDSACQGSEVTCGSGACSATCAGNAEKPDLACGSSCDCNPC